MVWTRGALCAIAAAATATALQPARAEFFGTDQVRALCRGETADAREFRTPAANRLLAQVSRERCRMYLLGLAEARLQRIGPEARAQCLPEGTADTVADALVEALLEPSEAPDGAVDAFVQETLRARFGCG